MRNRDRHNPANPHLDGNGRVKFKKPSDMGVFLKNLNFYADKSEDILGFIKREISFGADKLLLLGWQHFAKLFSVFQKGNASPAAKAANEFFERLIGNLSALSIIFTCVQAVLLLYKALHVIAFSKEDKYTRGVQLLAGVAAIALTAVSFIIFAGVITVDAPILFVLGSARGIFENATTGAIAIFQRFFSTRNKTINDRMTNLKAKIVAGNHEQDDVTELTRLINEQREGNEKILGKTQGTLLSTGMLIGSILLFTPAAPAGVIVLASLTAFALLDAGQSVFTKQNSTRLLARGVNALAGVLLGKPPFNLEVKTEKDVLAELQNKNPAPGLLMQGFRMLKSVFTPTPSSHRQIGHEVEHAGPIVVYNNKGKEKAAGHPTNFRSSSYVVNEGMAAQGETRESAKNSFGIGSVFSSRKESLYEKASREMAKELRTLQRQPSSHYPAYIPRVQRSLKVTDHKEEHTQTTYSK